MARSKRSRNRMISKASAPNSTREQRASKTQISTAAIEAIRHVVNILKPFELSPTQRLRTYQTMLLDDAVWTSFDSRASALETAQQSGYFQYDINSPQSVELYEFLKYNMELLEDQTPRSIGRCAAEMLINGWSPFEIVIHKADEEYPDKWKLKKLAYIHPLSLDPLKPYTLDQTANKILTLRQSGIAFFNGHQNSGTRLSWEGVKEIDFRKVAYCSYGGTSSQPMGTSPLDAAYTAWREKQLLQDYLLIGVTRDFSGTPVLRIPEDVLAAASADQTSPEAKQVNSLAQGMANMHSGDSSYVILPSDSQSESGNGLRAFDIQFLGVDGASKNFNITEIIEQKKRAIYNVLASQNLITGENGGGSYNLLEGQSSLQAIFVARDSMIIEEMWNKKVFPLLLDINGWNYKQSDLPKWKSGDVQPLSTEEFSKGVQRTQNFIPYIPKVLNQVYKGIGIDFEWDDKLTPDEIRAFLPTYENNTGQSDGTSGTGNTQAGGSASAVNSENAA